MRGRGSRWVSIVAYRFDSELEVFMPTKVTNYVGTKCFTKGTII